MRRVCTVVLAVGVLGLACVGSSSPPPARVPYSQHPDLEQIPRLLQLASAHHQNPLKRIVDGLGPPRQPLDETYRIGIYVNNVDDLMAALRTGTLVGEEAAGLWFRGGEIQPAEIFDWDHHDHERMKRANQEIIAIVRDCVAGRCPEDGVRLSDPTRRLIEGTFRGNGRTFVPDPEGHLRWGTKYTTSAPKSLDLAYSQVGPGWWVMVEGNDRHMYHASLFLDLPITPPLVFRAK
jgi:hypothetical protein